MDCFWVYILASQRNGTLYVGVTNDLQRRVFEHRSEHIAGFTRQYSVTRLVWYEQFSSINDARACESRVKRWHRKWKLKLIEAFNPTWADLYEQL